MERRKHKRFSATAFLNRQVVVTPLLPFIGKSTKAVLIDLSAGGLALVIGQIIPMGTRLHMKMTFPDHTMLEADTEVKRTVPYEREYLLGLEFLNLDPNLGERIGKMSGDYIDCESRIQAADPEACKGVDCAFFTMCTKGVKKDVLLDVNKEHNSITLIFSR